MKGGDVLYSRGGRLEPVNSLEVEADGGSEQAKSVYIQRKLAVWLGREDTHAAVADSGDSNDFHKSLLSNLASSFNLNRQNPERERAI